MMGINKLEEKIAVLIEVIRQILDDLPAEGKRGSW
jgi:hypothetical protein